MDVAGEVAETDLVIWMNDDTKILTMTVFLFIMIRSFLKNAGGKR